MTTIKKIGADDERPRVALIGASGVGKHHANWWTLEGADVRAFAGTSAESVAKTRAELEALFGFSGHGYTDIEEMLRVERPDIVDVCSPSPRHFEHARMALEAGCHVLCEKPFVYDPRVPRDELMAQARTLIELAETKGRRLGVCTQYSAAAEIFAQIWREKRRNATITHYHGHLESSAKNRPPDPERIWADLSPHLISVLLKLVPGSALLWDSLRTTFNGYEAIADFDVRTPDGQDVHCLIVTRNALQPPLNVRHFKCNQYPFVVEGEKGADGIYCARIETPDGNYLEPDMMRLLIRAFLKGDPVADLCESLTNLDWMLRIRDIAREQGVR